MFKAVLRSATEEVGSIRSARWFDGIRRGQQFFPDFWFWVRTNLSLEEPAPDHPFPPTPPCAKTGQWQLWGMKTRSRDQGRTAGVGSVKRPSPGFGPMGETRRNTRIGAGASITRPGTQLRSLAEKETYREI